ncbi:MULTISPECIES: hypothetical protein [Alcaligenes]|uniref:hypothetical protein n=1 Tax=Alcaligenes TaxID=507 RepID=UPI0002AAC2BD|nr:MULTISPECIES: hypothetical protein [Alcaligenes]EKU29796.1 hypothetical protein C660_12304 [Alcaligenes sp. HPC1271]ERI33800.1 hypothetical protein N879_08125 [Alcaligenes sp. EGD-AK7]UTM00382.1 hypothetical protein MID00_12830 [Alcaligenes sp. NLF5-7]HRO21242.1 hypothetical protein [Alcaligenes phenolicus]HRP12722.1 hypothetical protein [Alcaligenes phenolicus]
MKLYENITIGNFLFALGYSLRDKQRKNMLAGSVNLLQQTPADKLLGDVLLKFTGVVRLIEFKAEGANLAKEKSRHSILCVAVQERQFESISREVHWSIETKATENTLGLRVVPYLDAFPRPRGPKIELLEDFIHTLAKDIVTQNFLYTGAQINEYLAWVRRTQGKGEVGSGGLLLLAEPGGLLRFAPLTDLLELNLEHSLWIKERQAKLEKDLELVRQRAKERQYKLERKGLSLER